MRGMRKRHPCQWPPSEFSQNAHQAPLPPHETVPPISVNHRVCRLPVRSRAGLGFQQRTGREVDFARARAAPLRSRVDEVDSDRNRPHSDRSDGRGRRVPRRQATVLRRSVQVQDDDHAGRPVLYDRYVDRSFGQELLRVFRRRGQYLADRDCRHAQVRP